MKKKQVIIILILIFIILYGIISYCLSRNALTVSRYSIESSKLKSEFRVVQLTDLHNHTFGEHNAKLIDKVAEQSPDLILFTGDLLNSYSEDTSIATEVITGLSKIAPVYVSYGNHEAQYDLQYPANLNEIYTQAGANVLEYSYEDIEVNENIVRIGGIYGYCLPKEYTGETRDNETAYISDFQDTDLYTILMCHMPVCWINADGLNKWNVDCVFAGHAHGGQVRFPVLGGLYAPDQGWFPGRECGLYYSDDQDKVMVLSRGLGSHREKLPRFNNIPEIVVVDFVPAE